jgi:2-dehydro-3-deoxyphosphooctonate aldolase (KDO 8-P synthase)
MEVHDNPEEALCDGPNSIYLDKLEDILKDCLSIYNIVRKKLY